MLFIDGRKHRRDRWDPVKIRANPWLVFSFLWRHKILRIVLCLILGIGFCAVLFVVLGKIFFPLPIHQLRPPPSVVVLDRHEKLLRAFTAPDGMWRIPSTVEDISPRLRMAVLNYEDRYFRYHFGINPVSIVRAAVTNLKARRIVCGGSTITMQVARMMEPKPRTFKNKFIEVIRAIQLELSFSKDEILTFYFSMAPYGGNIVGSAAASYFYFNKEQKDLSLGEAALLAAIPNSPTALRPDAPASLARQGRDKVLNRLLQNGKITKEQLEEALAEPVPDRRFPMPFMAPHLTRELKQAYPGTNRIVSTIDRDTQILARDTLQEHIAPLKKHSVTTGAVVVMDTKTREVLALVGSADFFDEGASGQVNGTIAPRSPGSALKPFVYALALDRGLISPESLLTDVPVDYSGYRPVNYDDRFRGAVTAREALTHSLNVPAVNLAARLRDSEFLSLGDPRGGLYAFLGEAGITTLTEPEQHYGLSIILGGCGVTLLDLTNLYAGLANMGEFAPYRLRLDVEPAAGWFARARHASPLLKRGTAFILTEMLSEVERPDLPKCWESAVNLPKVAWKTGTSYGHKDAWSIGYSPQFTVGVWIGNFNSVGAPAIVGAEAAGPVLFDLFNSLAKQKDSRWYVQPAQVERREICALSGMVMSPHCPPQSKEEYYIPGVSPNETCTVHRAFAIDNETGTRLCSHSRIGREYEMKVFEIWSPKIATWMERNGMAVAKIPEHYPKCPKSIAGAGPVIHSPSANSEYVIRRGVNTEYQKILLEASVSNDTRNIFWFLDSELVFHGPPTEKVFITPVPGKHTLVCMDEEGRSTEMTLMIR
jgi:penicillin-binding protein 1C